MSNQKKFKYGWKWAKAQAIKQQIESVFSAVKCLEIIKGKN
jgi:hypothetical protein